MVPYGASDGASWENAWHLDDVLPDSGSVDWSSISPGDTLYVCGVHSAGYGDRSLNVSISGQVDAPVTIDGSCPKFPGATVSEDFDSWYFVFDITAFSGGWTQVPDSTDTDGISVYSRFVSECTSIQLIESLSVRLNKIPSSDTDPEQPAIAFDGCLQGAFFSPRPVPPEIGLSFTSLHPELQMHSSYMFRLPAALSI